MKKTIIIFLLSLAGLVMPFSARAQGGVDSNLRIGALGGVNLFRPYNGAKTWHFYPGASLFADYTVLRLDQLFTLEQIPLENAHFTVGVQGGAQYWRGRRYDLSAAPRFTLGWDFADWLEIHGGITAGLGRSNWRTPKWRFSYSAFIGAQLFLSQSFGITVELAYANCLSDLSAGLVFRL